jgi:TolB-like protein/class 3 adenylate cyclase
MPKDRRHATIMFTDIVGYTALMGSDEDLAFEVLAKNREIHQQLVEKYHGTLIKEMGDGMLVSFKLASDAVRCAIEIQKACNEQDIPLKIGIHEGEMVFAEGDVLGDGVNVASRLQDYTKEGCITISGSVYLDIMNKPGIKAEFIEEKFFKNVGEPIRVYKVFCDEIQQRNISPLISESKLPDKKSIIVLPFVNISPEPDQEYFNDGLTEEIITDLSHIHDLLVISRNSAMTFKGTKKKTQEIADEVNVHYVLEGSVRKAGNSLRITAQLINASNDMHLWAEKYSGTLDDIFDIQEKVSQSIVEALKIKLGPEEKQKIVSRPIDNFQAYDLHIKAQNIMLGWTTEGFERALQCLEKGLKIIGENEILYADIGQVHISYLETGLSKKESVFLKAEECIDKVFSINPNSSHGYYLKGHLNRWKGLVRESVISYKKALSIDPNHFFSRAWLSWLYAFSGKANAARPIITGLMTIDPLNPMSYMTAGLVEVMDGQFIKATEYIRKANQLETNTFQEWWYAKCYAYNNDIEESCHLLKDIKSQTEETQWRTLSTFFLFAVLGLKSKALDVVTEEFKEIMRGDELYPIWMAECYALINHKEEAINWIEEAINNNFINYPFLDKHDSFLENIRDEERFKKLMKRVKREWENFEV